MNKQDIIVSGARASGKLHIGNYLGALKQWLELQKAPNTQCYFFIADLHGMTTDFDPKELHQNTLDIAATYLAAGIDPNKSVFFLQNHILEHATLAWIFNCITPLAELERMTQFKDKAGIPWVQKEHFIEFVQTLNKAKEKKTTKFDITEINPLIKITEELVKIIETRGITNAGLLTYPTLMAADILMYKGTAVPVGEDQIQHVELTRVVARKFNNRFGQTFPEPKHLMRDENVSRIKSLADPAKKMSKTGDEALLLDDEPDEIARKLKKAITGSDASGNNPGAENLIYLLNCFGNQEQIKHFGSDQELGKLKYSELKEALAKDIADYFAEFREKKKELLTKPDYLAEVLGDGANKARSVAQETLLEVKQKIGLL